MTLVVTVGISMFVSIIVYHIREDKHNVQSINHSIAFVFLGLGRLSMSSIAVAVAPSSFIMWRNLKCDARLVKIAKLNYCLGEGVCKEAVDKNLFRRE